MSGSRDHPLNVVLDAMEKAMDTADESLAKMSADVGDFDARELTAAEDMLVFENPAVRYPDDVDQTTGMPLTNQQAAQRLLEELGPEAWVAHVRDVVRRADRRAKEAADG